MVRFTVRMPVALHADARRLASEAGISLSRFAREALAISLVTGGAPLAEPWLSSDRMADQRAISAIGEVILGALARDGDRIRAGLASAFPWAESLSDAARRVFVDELVRTGQGCFESGEFGPLTVTVADWKATAATRADPNPARTGGWPRPGNPDIAGRVVCSSEDLIGHRADRDGDGYGSNL